MSTRKIQFQGKNLIVKTGFLPPAGVSGADGMALFALIAVQLGVIFSLK
jgi:hypothetical protein